jgi:hypothetical protein
MSDWQPIETAPRDSSRILVFYRKWDGTPVVCEAWWAIQYESAPNARGWWQTMSGLLLSADVHFGPKQNPLGATHWMPLPEPPK